MNPRYPISVPIREGRSLATSSDKPDMDRSFLWEEITRLQTQLEALKEALSTDDQTLRLALGEMTAQEMRTLRAGLRWVLARATLETRP